MWLLPKNVCTPRPATDGTRWGLGEEEPTLYSDVGQRLHSAPSHCSAHLLMCIAANAMKNQDFERSPLEVLLTTDHAGSACHVAQC